VTDIWYYADGAESKGPLSLKQLVAALSGFSDPAKILVWRHGFEKWRTVDQVREVWAELFRPPPLPKPPPLPICPPVSVPPRIVGEPSVSVAEAAQFKNIGQDLTGISGWLVFVALGQVFGPLRLLVSLGEYYEKLDKSVVEAFPVTFLGEAAMNAGMLFFAVYTAVLFFSSFAQIPHFLHLGVHTNASAHLY
jgi:hypothetical protein